VVHREAVKVLTAENPAALREFFRTERPQVSASDDQAVEPAVSAVREIYERNVFAEMRGTFDTYANNIGHVDSPGHFRCHDDDHKSKAGKAIGQDCGTSRPLNDWHSVCRKGPRRQGAERPHASGQSQSIVRNLPWPGQGTLRNRRHHQDSCVHPDGAAYRIGSVRGLPQSRDDFALGAQTLTSIAQPSFLMIGYLDRPYTVNTVSGRFTYYW
jgi:hypothetical protein